MGLLIRAALVAAVAAVGCTEGDFSKAGWGFGSHSSAASSGESRKGGPSDSGAPSGKGTITVPEMTASEAATDAPSNKDMDQLHQRVQAYVNRFPVSDGEQDVNGAGPGQEAHSPRQAAPPHTSDTAFTEGTAVQASSQEPALRITPIVEQEAPIESSQAASPLKPTGANAIRLPDPTEDATQPRIGDSSTNEPDASRHQEPGHVDRASTSHESRDGWDLADRAADEGKAWPAVTGQPARLPPQPESATPGVQLIDVRPAGSEVGSESAPVKMESPANQPVAKVESSASGMDGYLRHLEARVASNPHQFDDLYKLRLLYAATGQRDKALAPVKDLDEAHSQLLDALLSVIALGDQVLTQPSGTAAEALTAVEELGRLLRQQTPVIIRNIAMVTRVNSFGDYVAINPPVFEEGFPVHVYIYTEIANFRSEPTADGRLRTVLSESVQVFDSAGKVVWEKSIPEFEDRTLTPRHDFFYPFEVKLPAELPAGQYALKVTVEDKLSATTDQQRITFSIQ